jgi:dienelactone hydrolase
VLARSALVGIAAVVFTSGAQTRDAYPAVTPALHVDQPIADMDVPVRIAVSGLTPGQTVRVSATSRTVTDRALISYAVFRADDTGSIDLSTAKPADGTYSRPDPMGLFWSMSPQPVPVEIWNHLNLAPFHPPDPWTVLLEVAPERGGAALATLRVTRLYAGQTLRTVDLHEPGLIGKLMIPARPDQNDRIPAVVLLGGSEGGLDEAGAALLASHGYAVLTLAYFGVDGTPSELVNIPVEGVLRAVGWLQSRPEVDRGRIAVIGRSRGSELALLAASASSEIRAVIAISPSSVVWGGISKSPDLRAVSAWTYEGRPLPFLSANQAPADIVQEFYAKGPLQSRLYDFLFSDSDAVERATIPVERIHGPVMLISGTDDRVWGSPIMARRIVERATRLGREGSLTNLIYEGAGHNIREPYRPTPGQARLGGTAENHARAEQDSWQKMLAFLEQNLAPSVPHHEF